MQRTIRVRILFLVCIYIILGKGRIYAQESSTPAKLYVQYSLSGHYFKPQAGNGAAGFGSGFKIGYGFSKHFLLYVGTKGAFTGDTRLLPAQDKESMKVGMLALGAQYNLFFLSTPRMLPYIDIAIHTAGALIDDEAETKFSAPGFSPGIGVRYFVSSKLALDVNLAYSDYHFRRTITDDATESVRRHAFSTDLQVGLAWFPFRAVGNHSK